MPLPFLFVATTAVFFIVVGLAFLREGWLAPTRRVRNLALLAAGLSAQFAIGAGWASGLEAAELGWISTEAGDFVNDWGGLVVETIALALGVTAVVLVRKSDSTLRQAARMTAILTQRLAHVSRLSELHLTAREIQVLELMSTGVHTDEELSKALSISPATAATHLRNIMRKAGVRKRQDLLLLGAPEG